MKKVSATLVLVFLVGVATLAYGQRKPLGDKQLDQISAGSAIANGESSASDSREFEVSLMGSALNGASGVNIVSAADSTVAGATNAWSGDHLNNAVLAQANAIAQKGIPNDGSSDGKITAATTHGAPETETETDVATGTAIALDGSSAHSSTEMSVELSDMAEANAKAVNIVNAAGSLVANGVNVASSTNLNNLTLTQTNAIAQTAH
jgi:hypothetical protein